MAIGNHRALSLVTKGMAYSDPLTKGMLVAMTRIYLEDGDIIIIPPPGGGGDYADYGVGGGYELPDHLKLQPFRQEDNQLKTNKEYLDELKKKLNKRKIVGIEVTLVRKSINPNIEISVDILKQTLKASLIEEEIIDNKSSTEITVKLI